MPAVLVTGAAGFIGSHLVDALLARGDRVIGVDNFLRGTRENLATAFAHGNFVLHSADLADFEACDRLAHTIDAENIHAIWHLAANSDIPAGVEDLNVDLRQTFLTTVGSLRIAKHLRAKDFYFTSTSAVYGEREGLIAEDTPHAAHFKLRCDETCQRSRDLRRRRVPPEPCMRLPSAERRWFPQHARPHL